MRLSIIHFMFVALIAIPAGHLSAETAEADPTQATCGPDDNCGASGKTCMDECMKAGDDESDCNDSCILEAKTSNAGPVLACR